MIQYSEYIIRYLDIMIPYYDDMICCLYIMIQYSGGMICYFDIMMQYSYGTILVVWSVTSKLWYDTLVYDLLLRYYDAIFWW